MDDASRDGGPEVARAEEGEEGEEGAAGDEGEPPEDAILEAWIDATGELDEARAARRQALVTAVAVTAVPTWFRR